MAVNRNKPRGPGYEPVVNECSFVTSNGTQKTGDREVQRKIRANAMRNYWRRRRFETKSVSDDASTQTRSVTSEESPRDLVLDDSARIWWWENEQPKVSAGLVEATVETKDWSSKQAVRNEAADCDLLPSRAASRTARATHPQKQDTDKKCDHEETLVNESSVTSLSISVGDGIADPFNASALEGSRRDSFLLSHRKAKEHILQGYHTDES